MAKTETFQDLALGDRRVPQERWRWLYYEIRAAIIDGRLRTGSRLPSSRNLAKQYEFSRGTVTTAFAQLAAEGYVSAEVGAGTFVLPTQLTFTAPHGQALAPARSSRAGLSASALEFLRGTAEVPMPQASGTAFRDYEPALDQFPVELWARIASRVYRKAPRTLYGSGDPGGYYPLRRAIAEYVGSSRGVKCSPEQILVTSGAQQAIDLIARLLLDPGDAVWMEDPGYFGAAESFRAARANIVRIPVDSDGLQVERGVELAPKARLAYVTPANQFPLGIVMSAQRRTELLNWAVRVGAWVIEDEYDAEYRYVGKPVSSLQSIDRSGSVLYVGTFTKMLFNSLRLGFIVLPQQLVDPFKKARAFVDRHPCTLDQAVLAEFMNEGHFGSHVRKMRQLYGERSSFLMKELRRRLSHALEVQRTSAGMRAIAWLKVEESDRAVAKRATLRGVEVVPLSRFTVVHKQRPALILGFAASSVPELRRGLSVLETVFPKKRNSPHPLS